MKIWIIRHGDTAYNVGEQRFRGQVELQLSENGIIQAEKVASSLKNISLDQIYYSRLIRAKDVAKRILDQQNSKVPFIEESALCNLNFGDFEGKTLKEVFPLKSDQKLWLSDPTQFIIPNGDNFYCKIGEIHNFFLKLRRLTKTYDNIALVSHGSVISLIFIYLLKQDPSFYWSWYVNTCSLSLIILNEEGSVKLKKFNDTHHLL